MGLYKKHFFDTIVLTSCKEFCATRVPCSRIKKARLTDISIYKFNYF